jgi:hypothetical protein
MDAYEIVRKRLSDPRSYDKVKGILNGAWENSGSVEDTEGFHGAPSSGGKGAGTFRADEGRDNGILQGRECAAPVDAIAGLSPEDAERCGCAAACRDGKAHDGTVEGTGGGASSDDGG